MTEDTTQIWVVLYRQATGSTVAVLHPTPTWMMPIPAARVHYWQRYFRHQMPGWTVWGERADGPDPPD